MPQGLASSTHLFRESQFLLAEKMSEVVECSGILLMAKVSLLLLLAYLWLAKVLIQAAILINFAQSFPQSYRLSHFHFLQVQAKRNSY